MQSLLDSMNALEFSARSTKVSHGFDDRSLEPSLELLNQTVTHFIILDVEFLHSLLGSAF